MTGGVIHFAVKDGWLEEAENNSWLDSGCHWGVVMIGKFPEFLVWVGSGSVLAM